MWIIPVIVCVVLLLVDGAEHGTGYLVQNKEYKQMLCEFLMQ